MQHRSHPPTHDPTAFAPLTRPAQDALFDARAKQHRAGQSAARQMAGRRWPVACVSLEVTQRCNLDCTLCYLSESSEAVRDFPLEVGARPNPLHPIHGPIDALRLDDRQQPATGPGAVTALQRRSFA